MRLNSKFLHIISATDSSCGAGTQQDVRVAMDHNVWPVTTVSGVTAQTFDGVIGVEPVSNKIFEKQLECGLSFKCGGLKIGALLSIDQMKMVWHYIKKNPELPVVIDPVFSPTEGRPFYSAEMQLFLANELLPLSCLVTPNLEELKILTQMEVLTVIETVKIIGDKYKGKPLFYIKGGHEETASKYIKEYLVGEEIYTLKKARWNLQYTHGTGCAMATATACNIIKGKSIKKSAFRASKYITNLYKRINRELCE